MQGNETDIKGQGQDFTVISYESKEPKVDTSKESEAEITDLQIQPTSSSQVKGEI